MRAPLVLYAVSRMYVIVRVRPGPGFGRSGGQTDSTSNPSMVVYHSTARPRSATLARTWSRRVSTLPSCRRLPTIS
jgi:hypothetical protein